MTDSNSKTIRVRRLAVSDAHDAAEMFHLLVTVFEEGGSRVSERYAAEVLANPGFWAIGAFDEAGRVVGGLTAHTLPMTREETSEVFIYDIAVDQEWQRRGIGREMIDFLLASIGRQNISSVFVPADADDEDAIAFYRSLGGASSPVVHFTFER